MPEPETTLTGARFSGELNEAQQLRLSVSCGYMDKLLSDVEHVLHQATSESPFPRYIVDVNPAQIRVLEDHIRRLRVQLLRAMDWQHLKPHKPDIPATRAVLVNLNFIDIAIEELRPRYMRGCGPVPEDAVEELNGVVHELRTLVEGMERYVRQDLGANLQSRLQRLEQTGYDVRLFRAIEEIVTRHGMVEFHSRMAALVGRLEDDNLEVALFGRVSSGKSSLLNALLGTNVLPVGVNPITAVPTKLRYGSALRAAVTYGDGRSEMVPVENLTGLVTEQGNPGNLRNVVRAIVEVPSPRLRQGIVLVDTPGLGSLAKRGTQETLAYLPACDLALLLIDSSVTLNEEDIGTLRLLYEAGIPAIVLLSKADLLAEGDLHRIMDYIQIQLRRELNLDIQVQPVSSLSSHSVLLDHFFERELLPRFEQARALRQASVSRKIGALRDSVLAALETTLHEDERGRSEDPVNTQELESQLRLVTGEIGEQSTRLNHAFLEFGETPQAIIREVTDRAVSWLGKNSGSRITSLQLSEWIHDTVQKFVDRQVEEIRIIIRRAVDTLQNVARAMGRTDGPAHEESGALLRDMPRFEMAALPDEINVKFSKWFGKGIVRSVIKGSLSQGVGPLFKEELYLYGRALSQWGEQVIRRAQLFVSSYADGYRVQLQRMSGLSKGGADIAQIRTDLGFLLNWASTDSSEVLEKRA